MRKYFKFFLVALLFTFPVIGKSDSENKTVDYIEYYNRSVKSYKAGGYSESLEACNKAIELNPKDVGLYILKALIIDGLGEIVFESWLDIDNLKAFYELKGSILNELGHKTLALKAYDKAINVNDGHLYRKKGFILYELGQQNLALEACNKAIELDPKDSISYGLKSLILYKLGHETLALETYNKYIEIDYGSHHDSDRDKSLILYKLGQQNLALEACNETIASFSKPAGILYGLKSLILRKSGQPNLALEACDKAIELSPNNKVLYSLKSSILNELGQNQILELNPKVLYALKSLILDKLATYNRLLEIYNKEDDDNTELRSLTLDKLEQYNQVFEACNKAIESIPMVLKDEALYKIRDSILYKLGQNDFLLEEINKAFFLHNHAHTHDMDQLLLKEIAK
ncbi:MAG: hypothetical protein ACEY3D_08970 [Rickettsia sp.]|uniref:tetratricopeptide repeat protein n=1 Tax=Rickettsia sp. TaxID=789 RepID=UPI00397E0605